MQPIVTDRVAWSVCQSVCHSRAVQKWLNRLRCCLDCRLRWAQGNMY